MANFTDVELLTIWNKGTIIQGYSPATWRRDYLGNAMKFSSYGLMDDIYGWNVDHILPKSLRGSDFIINLRPLNCRVNSSRQDARF